MAVNFKVYVTLLDEENYVLYSAWCIIFSILFNEKQIDNSNSDNWLSTVYAVL
jgi:hypothetical protein